MRVTVACAVPFAVAFAFGPGAAGCSRSHDDPFRGSSAASQPGRPGSAVESTEPTVTVTPPTGALAGADTVARIVVTPPTGFHVNQEYPLKLELAPTAGVTLTHPSMTRDDTGVELASAYVAFGIHLTPTAGSHDVTGKLAVGFCGDTTCITRHLPIAIAVAAR
jgi:hypothetical protein